MTLYESTNNAKKRRELPEGEYIWDAFSFKKHKPFIDWETRGKAKKKRVEMKKQKSTSTAREFSNKRAFWRLILSVAAAM